MAKGKPKFNKRLNAAIPEVVKYELRDGIPPETRQAYERLMNAGYSDQETRGLIGSVVVSEIFKVLRNEQPYDRDRYVSALERLPTLPWE